MHGQPSNALALMREGGETNGKGNFAQKYKNLQLLYSA